MCVVCKVQYLCTLRLVSAQLTRYFQTGSKRAIFYFSSSDVANILFFSPLVYLCSPQQMSQEWFSTLCSLSVRRILCVLEEAGGKHWVHQVLSSIQPLTASHCICWGSFSKTLASQQRGGGGGVGGELSNITMIFSCWAEEKKIQQSVVLLNIFNLRLG